MSRMTIWPGDTVNGTEVPMCEYPVGAAVSIRNADTWKKARRNLRNIRIADEAEGWMRRQLRVRHGSE
jgi:hypothetical protein